VEYSLIRVEPKTGRQHQIRVHMAAIGHPLVADHLYGGNQGLRWQVESGEVEEMSRFALHAERMTVIHPATGRPLELTAPPPQDFTRLSAALRKGLDLESFPLENDFGIVEEEDPEDGARSFSHIPIGRHEHDVL
jgi:23S rRNA pseudouridine1911/1915/1917 synthase